MIASYNPSKHSIIYHLSALGSIIYHLSALGSILDKVIQKYDNMLLIEVSEEAMHNFLINYSLKCLIKEANVTKTSPSPVLSICFSLINIEALCIK